MIVDTHRLHDLIKSHADRLILLTDSFSSERDIFTMAYLQELVHIIEHFQRVHVWLDFIQRLLLGGIFRWQPVKQPVQITVSMIHNPTHRKEIYPIQF